MGSIDSGTLNVSSDESHAYAEFRHDTYNGLLHWGPISEHTLEIFNYSTSCVKSESGKWVQSHSNQLLISAKGGRLLGYIFNQEVSVVTALTVNESLFSRSLAIEPIADPESHELELSFFASTIRYTGIKLQKILSNTII